MKIGMWSFKGRGEETVVRQGSRDEVLAKLKAQGDGMSIDSGGYLFIPDVVLVEWLSRRGWVVTKKDR